MTLEKKTSAFNDPAFAHNKTRPIHRWVPWIAGFSSHFVRDALHRYLDEKSTVLDPFAGVGTTLVEAVLLGHRGIGFEINPYAALAARMKINADRIDVQILQETLLNFQTFYTERIGSQSFPKSQPPQGFKTRSEFYSPQVLKKVLTVLDFIDTLDNLFLQELFKLVFASTMVRYSNYSYEPSLSRRVTAGKPEIIDFPVEEAIIAKLEEIATDIAKVDFHQKERCENFPIIEDSFLNYQNYLTPESVDAIVTSPPYLNNYHYNRNTRPQLYWLGFANNPKDLKRLEHLNFGKYWQTVRDRQPIDLEFRLPESDIDRRLETIRQINPEKGIYGGSGWANYAASYFNDCYKFAQGIHYVLKSGGTALVVIGNSILQGILIPTDQYFGKIAELVGLELVNIDIPRSTRVGNSIIQSEVRVAKAKKSHHLYEAIVELRKR
ncbi:DNA methyltransferase [Phormidium sp. CCY1219]|uniref:DNA methyltransferase n=1 Tax=Phormidium sp. CCY1219 TaxID=2886104 RepID=UPI002D1E920C|nr:DNA methyltransferase [Phormidium sp. CCY1219]MEB3828201.1 site-specific DNA-methyltransferase [Phormidium sp. CCY1219]